MFICPDISARDPRVYRDAKRVARRQAQSQRWTRRDDNYPAMRGPSLEALTSKAGRQLDLYMNQIKENQSRTPALLVIKIYQTPTSYLSSQEIKRWKRPIIYKLSA